MALDFIRQQSKLVFKLKKVTLVVFDKENIIIMTGYDFIVTFNFVGNGSDRCSISEKGDET